MNVLFVCTANTCRSPMAAAYFRHLCVRAGALDIEIASGGVAAAAGAEISPQARFALWREGLALEEGGSRALTLEGVCAADRIVAMTREQARFVAAQFPQAAAKVRTLLSYIGRLQADVSDPFGGDSETYIACLESMKPALAALLVECRR